ncbi:MAG TPA: energy transducer TonB [Luteimonas sp.]|nr:energy transducer TonB [Luteimonas sp.]
MNAPRPWALLALLALALAGTATARAPESVRKQVEASMLLTGSIDIAPDGSVGGYAIDHDDQLPDYVRAYLAREVPGWKFAPVLVDGRAVRARSRMSLRMVATPAGDGNFKVTVGGVSFGEYNDEATDQVTRGRLSPPAYPPEAYRVGGKGAVYLVLRVGRDGKVEDAVVEQVNLTAIGDERQMGQLRRRLGDASLRAARHWTFRTPTTGEAADDASWSVRVPVAFHLADDREPEYGTWQAYLPGPRQRAPWITEEGAGSPDALAGDGVYPMGGGIRLLTPLQRQG